MNFDVLGLRAYDLFEFRVVRGSAIPSRFIGASLGRMRKRASKAHFISDLHLLANRSTGPMVQRAIDEAISQSHTFILGGDIFDFRWSSYRSHERSIEQSIRYLKNLLAINPECQFHYILGNHDALPGFTQRLEQLAGSNPKLQWHPHLLRIGSSVFLHGDIIDSKIPLEADFHELLDARRLRSEERALPHPLYHSLYDAAVQTRIHRAVAHFANSNRKVMTQVTDYLSWAKQDRAAGVEQVYFGHTHRPVDRLRYSGLEFHNPGAAIKGLPFRILPVDLPVDLPVGFPVGLTGDLPTDVPRATS